MDKVSKWQKLSTGRLPNAAATVAPICIGSSIWVDADGLVEFHSDSHTVSSKYRYPTPFIKEGWYGSVITCKYKGDSIVVIDGLRCIGIVFNTKTRKFSDIFSFQNEFGCYSSCVAIGDYIHIFHGNGTGNDVVYSLTDKSSRIIKDKHVAKTGQTLYEIPVIKTNDCYQSTNKLLISGFARNQNGRHIPLVIVNLISKFYKFELFKFGGLDLHDGQCVDSFYIGSLENGDPSKPIQWRLVSQYKLNHPLGAFGYIQYGPFIVTFGGVSDDESSNCRTDDIYILDLRRDCGWIRSPIKCPQKAKYHAVLDSKQRIHLQERTYFSWGHGNHYCINLNDIIDLKIEKVDLVESVQDSWTITSVYIVVSTILIWYLHSTYFQS